MTAEHLAFWMEIYQGAEEIDYLDSNERRYGAWRPHNIRFIDRLAALFEECNVKYFKYSAGVAIFVELSYPIECYRIRADEWQINEKRILKTRKKMLTEVSKLINGAHELCLVLQPLPLPIFDEIKPILLHLWARDGLISLFSRI